LAPRDGRARLFPEALLARLALYGVGLTAVKERLDG
jgi:hypothetical protein